MAKIIKINEEHYVVVDDLEIKEGDWIIDIKHPLSPRQIKTKYLLEDLFDSEKKITHSTLPLELLSENGLSGMGFSKIRPLNVFEVEELIGEVDVEKKAREEHEQALKRGGSEYAAGYYEGLLDGYNQALEDNKKKKYTEEDMFRMLCLGNKLEKTNFDDENFSVFFNMFKKHIQSLQPKTEWEVEIVDGKLKLK